MGKDYKELVELSVEPNNEKEMETQKRKQIIYNTKNVNERQTMKDILCGDLFDGLFCDMSTDIDEDVNLFIQKWNEAMSKSFHLIKPSKSMMRGVDEDLKQLLGREKWIRKNVLLNPERGRQLAEIQKQINAKIESNNTAELEKKVNDILQSDNPHSKVFHV